MAVTVDDIVRVLKARPLQNPYATRVQIAEALGLPAADVSREVTVSDGPDGPFLAAIDQAVVKRHPEYLEFRAV